LSVESLIADSGKSGDYAVVAFGNAIVLISGGTVLRRISNCLTSFIGGSTESIDLGMVIRSAFEAVV